MIPGQYDIIGKHTYLIETVADYWNVLNLHVFWANSLRLIQSKNVRERWECRMGGEGDNTLYIYTLYMVCIVE